MNKDYPKVKKNLISYNYVKNCDYQMKIYFQKMMKWKKMIKV